MLNTTKTEDCATENMRNTVTNTRPAGSTVVKAITRTFDYDYNEAVKNICIIK